MRRAGRDELGRVGRKLIAHSERVLERAEQVQAAATLIADSVVDIAWTEEPEQVRQRVESVRTGVLRAVLLLNELSVDSGAMLGLVQAREAIEDDRATQVSQGNER